MDGRPGHTLGRLLYQHRIAAGMSQEVLASAASVSVHTISNVEREVGHTPRNDTLTLLADALGLAPEQRRILQDAAVRLRTAHAAAHAAVPATVAASGSGPGSVPGSDPSKPLTYQLPIPPTPLIGREGELAALGVLLHASTGHPETRMRLLTLVGSPGVGKTRMGIEVARAHAASFRDGAWFVPLAPINAPEFVAPAIAHTLGLREGGAQTVHERLLDHLRTRHTLIVLDNFEHLAAAAPFLADLLTGCPEIILLVTSRTPVGIRAEQQYRVAQLPLPDHVGEPPLAQLAEIPSIALFVARARAVQPDFVLDAENAADVAAICCHLDGLPLAIELAASRTRLFAPNTLLTRLDTRLNLLTGGPADLAPHQRTLRTTLDWSYALLSPDAQMLFRRLAVFVGGIPLAGVGPVCAGMEAGEGGSWLLDHLMSLVEHGLIFRVQNIGDEPRFSMLETIREYGLERLHVCGEDDFTARAHAAYYLALAETAIPNLRGSRHPQSLEWFEQEHGNLRTAFVWALTTHDIEIGLRLAGALWRFWYERGHIGEGRDLLAALLRQVENVGDDLPQALRPAWAKALAGAGNLAIEQGEYAEATALLEQALTVRRALGNLKEVAAALNALGMALAFSGALARAQELLEESLLIRRELGDREATARALGNLGRLMIAKGASARAVALFEESVLLYRQTDNRSGLAMTLNDWAEALRLQGETQRAADVGTEGLTLFRASGHTFGIAVTLETLGSVAYQAGEYERALEYGRESVALNRQTGHWEYLADTLAMLGLVSCAREQHEQAAAFLAEAMQVYQEFLRSRVNGKTCWRLASVAVLLGQRQLASNLYRTSLEKERAVGSTWHMARSLEGLARVACAQGEHERAARLEGAAAKERQAAGTPLPPFEHAVMERTITRLRRTLGDVRFERAWEAGQALRLEQAIAEALET